jgi:uroporphyrinogen decarboxylase
MAGRKYLVLEGPGDQQAAAAVAAAGGEAVRTDPAGAAAAILAGDGHGVLFGDGGQGAALLDAAAMDGQRVALRRRLRDLEIIALGGAAGGLRRLGLEPARESDGRDLAAARPGTGERPAPSPFLDACRGRPVPYTPLWLMRQAGRYMEEYRRIRARGSMLDLCKSPERVSEVTVHAAEFLGVDAAILFADLLLIVEPLGLKLEYLTGEGPAITPAVRSGQDVDRLREVAPEDLQYVYDAVRMTRADLVDRIPLIGFAGAPFTVASYLVEGGSSRSFQHTKELMYKDPGAWNALMEKIVRGTAGYMLSQVAAGADALQIFDSWVGCLSPADYRRYVQPHTARLLREIGGRVPVIHFGTGTATLLPAMAEAGGDVIGLDWRVELDEAWQRVGHDRPVMGNLDPLTLFAGEDVLRREVGRILGQAAGRAGHIFNLGHGILPGTPVDHVRRLVDLVHELSAR